MADILLSSRHMEQKPAPEHELIDNAIRSREMKFIAMTTVSSLHFLKELSRKRKIPMDKITVEHIIQECSQADQIFQ